MRARSPVQRSAPTYMLSQLRARRMASAATVLLARLGGDDGGLSERVDLGVRHQLVLDGIAQIVRR